MSTRKSPAVNAVFDKTNSITQPRRRNKKYFGLTTWLAIILIITGSILSLPVFAGAEPTPDDVLPGVYNIRFNESDVILNNELVLLNGNFQSVIPIKDYSKKLKTIGRLQRCELPQKLNNQLEMAFHAGIPWNDGKNRPVLIHCDKKFAWLSLGAYCSEGTGIHGKFIRLNMKTGNKLDLSNLIGKCSNATTAVDVGDELWVLSTHPGEYYDSPNDISIINNKSKVVTGRIPIQGTTINYNPFTSEVWVAQPYGLCKISVASKAHDCHYYTISLKSGLPEYIFSRERQPIGKGWDKPWINYQIAMFGVIDINEFRKAWNDVIQNKSDPNWGAPDKKISKLNRFYGKHPTKIAGKLYSSTIPEPRTAPIDSYYAAGSFVRLRAEPSSSSPYTDRFRIGTKFKPHWIESGWAYLPGYGFLDINYVSKKTPLVIKVLDTFNSIDPTNIEERRKWAERAYVLEPTYERARSALESTYDDPEKLDEKIWQLNYLMRHSIDRYSVRY